MNTTKIALKAAAVMTRATISEQYYRKGPLDELIKEIVLDLRIRDETIADLQHDIARRDQQIEALETPE